jgi:AraC-like DNA-binding protein
MYQIGKIFFIICIYNVVRSALCWVMPSLHSALEAPRINPNDPNATEPFRALSCAVSSHADQLPVDHLTFARTLFLKPRPIDRAEFLPHTTRFTSDKLQFGGLRVLMREVPSTGELDLPAGINHFWLAYRPVELPQRMEVEFKEGLVEQPLRHEVALEEPLEGLCRLLTREVETGCRRGTGYFEGLSQALASALVQRLGRSHPARRDLRIEHAVRLLEQRCREKVSLEEVAQAAGFSDQTHLTRHFRRAFGQTPARWNRGYEQPKRSARTAYTSTPRQN